MGKDLSGFKASRVIRCPRVCEKCYVPIFRIALAFLLLSLAPVAYAQAYQRYNERPPACEPYDKVPAPVADLPTVQERKALASCDSEDLYFGFNRTADPVKARKCAYIERDAGKGVPETAFGAAGLLTMIYANGKGAVRNFDLALKSACEVDGAPAENYGRFEHLLEMKQQHWNGDDFNLCDDATSGFMQGLCAGLQNDIDRKDRTRRLSAITAKWTASEQKAFRELQKAAMAYFEASSRNEVDLSGTARAAFEIEAEESLNEAFIAAVEGFEKGQLPNFTSSDFIKSDAELNSIRPVLAAGLRVVGQLPVLGHKQRSRKSLCESADSGRVVGKQVTENLRALTFR